MLFEREHHLDFILFQSLDLFYMYNNKIIKLKVKNDHRSKFSNLNNWKEEAWKNQGFKGIRTRDLRDTGAMLHQLQLSYEATHWERGQFIEFISPVRSEIMWSIYEIIHMFELLLIIRNIFSQEAASPSGGFQAGPGYVSKVRCWLIKGDESLCSSSYLTVETNCYRTS